MAYEGYGLPRGVILEELMEPTLEANQNVLIIKKTHWIKPIIKWLESGTLLKDEEEVKRVQKATLAYTFDGNTLYKRLATHLWLRCVMKEEGEYVSGKSIRRLGDLMK